MCIKFGNEVQKQKLFQLFQGNNLFVQKLHKIKFYLL